MDTSGLKSPALLDLTRLQRRAEQTLDRISSAEIPLYDENTFTPTIRGTGTAGTGTYTTQNGRYTRIGRVVFFELYVVWTNLTGTPTGTLAVGGLPFTSSSASTFPAVTIGWANNIALTANNVMTAYVQNNSTQIYLYQYPVGGGATTGVPIDTAGGIILNGQYSL